MKVPVCRVMQMAQARDVVADLAKSYRDAS